MATSVHLTWTAAAGWALVHSVWQITVIWLLHRLVQRLMRRADIRHRYAACVLMLAACPVAALATACTITWTSGLTSHTALDPSGLIPLVSLPTLTPAWADLLRHSNAVLVPLVWAWLIVAAVRLTATSFAFAVLQRTLAGLPHVRRPTWDLLAERLIPRRTCRVLESSQIGSPASFGVLKSFILVPAGIVNEFSSAYLDVYIAHELAHLSRRDSLVNVLQSLIGAILWYHPLAGRLSADLTELREECCDELAVSALDGRRDVYIQAMAALSERPATPGLLLGAVDGNLFARLQHLVDRTKRPPTRRMGGVAIAASLAVVVGIALTGRDVAAKVEARRDIALVSSVDSSVAIYKLLGVPDAGPAFSDAVERAVQSRRRLTAEEAVDLSKVINRGSAPKALLYRSLLASTAKDLRVRTTSDWTGGGGLAWDDLSESLYTFARESKNPAERTGFARAALLLAAQDRLNAGSRLFRIVQERDFATLTGYPDATVQELRLIARVWSSTMADTVVAFDTWRGRWEDTLPPQWRDGLADRSYLQWRLANYWFRLREDSPEKADRLRESVPATPKNQIFHSLTGAK